LVFAFAKDSPNDRFSSETADAAAGQSLFFLRPLFEAARLVA
jgi:hypothetical protein